MAVIDQRRTRNAILIALFGIVAVFLCYLALGSVGYPILDIAKHLLSGDSGGSDPLNTIVWRIRLPRACACLFIGGTLAAIGSIFQSLFRNPLAEPYVIGVSSGASVGGTLAILFGVTQGLLRILSATLGALGSLILVLLIARRREGMNMQSIILGGVVIGSLLSGLTTLNLSLAGQDSGKILFWLLGSATPMYWDRVFILLFGFVVSVIVLIRNSRGLNAFSVSEFMAERQGVDIRRLRWECLSIGSLATGIVVGSAGVIGFVGLVGPHIARRILGNDVRKFGPLACILGSGILLFADLLAQRLKPGTELPLGAVTAIIGAPVLLWLLKQQN